MAFKLKNKGIPEKFQNGYNRQSSLIYYAMIIYL